MEDNILELDQSNEVRITVLHFSIAIENLLSQYLCGLLNIKKEDSKSFGNSSSSLSFNQKVNLLIDTNFISSEAEKKFRAFMEIRNQFIHNRKADSFVNCLNLLPGREKYLLKTYSNIKGDDLEKRLF